MFGIELKLVGIGDELKLVGIGWHWGRGILANFKKIINFLKFAKIPRPQCQPIPTNFNLTLRFQFFSQILPKIC